MTEQKSKQFPVLADWPVVTDGAMLDLNRYVPAFLTFLANKLSRGASALYRKHFGIGIIEWRIMSLLALEPDITANRICQVIGLDKGAASRSLRVMEAMGLAEVHTDSRDARRRLTSLTPAGHSLHDRIILVALERERRLLDCLAPDECHQLVGLLDRLHRNLDAVNQPIAIPPGPKARRAAPGRAEKA